MDECDHYATAVVTVKSLYFMIDITRVFSRVIYLCENKLRTNLKKV
jgi:hypothetical protein